MKCPFPKTIYKRQISKITYENSTPHPSYSAPVLMKVPCGKCSICRQNNINDWIVRCEEEFKNCISAYFVTLTYDDDCLPLNKLGLPTFCKEDVQKFFKRMRKKFTNLEYPIKYLLTSEYGDNFLRPHYHMVLFNYPNINDPLQVQNEISSLWQKGFVSVAAYSAASARYVLKYLAKEKQISNDYACETDIPFLLSSRRPAVGANYINNTNIARNLANKKLTYNIQNFSYKLPKYYTNKLREFYPNYLEQLRIENLNNEENNPHDDYRNRVKSLNESISFLERKERQCRDRETYVRLRKQRELLQDRLEFLLKDYETYLDEQSNAN